MIDLKKNDEAWNVIFERFKILDEISRQGQFVISAKKIKDVGKREARLMSKFDHSCDLPSIFRKNKLAILPISRGDYVISKFNAYHTFEQNTKPIKNFPLPEHITSINIKNIPSETIAINAAFASGILDDFFEDNELCATVSGRMGSGKFSFSIKEQNNQNIAINVENSQIEIDSAYEGVSYLSILEAKNELSDDFLIRQLYYPFRTLCSRGLKKKIKPVFLVYSNGIFSLYEYMFEDEMLYNSLKLVKCERYSIEDTEISLDDVLDVLGNVSIEKEPPIAFPQADKFERVINLCELLNNQPFASDQITQNYDFDVRQTNYYTRAAEYLGLVNNIKFGHTFYEISPNGREILAMPYKKRQLAYCTKILQHKVFYDTFIRSLEQEKVLDKAAIVPIMKDCHLYKVGSDSTFERRASTIRGWISWIFSLFQSKK